jgi:transcriptional regulator with XRE-family HTH domain
VDRLNNSNSLANRQEGFADAQEISVRLRAARKKARLNQSELGKIGGVSLNTQSGYESGTLPPLDYLLRIGEAGIDWYWVVTGNRITGDPLNDSALDLLAVFNALPDEIQALVLMHAHALKNAFVARAEKAKS